MKTTSCRERRRRFEDIKSVKSSGFALQKKLLRKSTVATAAQELLPFPGTLLRRSISPFVHLHLHPWPSTALTLLFPDLLSFFCWHAPFHVFYTLSLIKFLCGCLISELQNAFGHRFFVADLRVGSDSIVWALFGCHFGCTFFFVLERIFALVYPFFQTVLVLPRMWTKQFFCIHLNMWVFLTMKTMNVFIFGKS